MTCGHNFMLIFRGFGFYGSQITKTVSADLRMRKLTQSRCIHQTKVPIPHTDISQTCLYPLADIEIEQSPTRLLRAFSVCLWPHQRQAADVFNLVVGWESCSRLISAMNKGQPTARASGVRRRRRAHQLLSEISSSLLSLLLRSHIRWQLVSRGGVP